MFSPNIKVHTIDYYHRDQFMNVKIGLHPKKLNENHLLFNRPRECPHINLNVEVPDHGAGELHMESILEYLRQKPSILQKYETHFVTNKQLLKCVATSEYETIEVQAVKIDGVIYMLKLGRNLATKPNFEKVFEHFLTKKTENECIGEDRTVQKAVFWTVINRGRGLFRNWNIVYSGEIDAIDEDSNHYELIALNGEVNDQFWKNQSCSLYWQSFLNNVKTIVVGSVTGEHPDRYKINQPFNRPEFYLNEIKTFEVDKISRIAIKAAFDLENKRYIWTIPKSQKELNNFLDYVSTVIQKDGDCAVLSKARTAENWECRMMNKETAWFHQFVGDRLTNPPPNEDDVKAAETTSKDPAPIVPLLLTKSVKNGSVLSLTTVVSETFEKLKIQEPPMTTKEYAEKSAQTDLTPHPIDLPIIPGALQTQPKSKIIFNAPFDEELTYPVKIINSTESAIGFSIRIKKTDEKQIVVSPSSGVLGSRESVRCMVFLNGNNMNGEEDRLIIEWVNVQAGSKFDTALLDEDGLFRRKALIIEYND